MVAFEYMLFALLFGFGLYYIASDKLCYPSLRSILAVNALSPKKSSWEYGFVYPVAKHIQKIIHFNPYTRREIERQLQAANIDFTPEFYYAVCFSNAIIMLIPAIIMLPVMPLLSVVFVIAGIVLFFNTKNKVIYSANRRCELMEEDIPKFTESICQSLTYKQDIESMIRNYRHVSGKEFKGELDLLLTNIRTDPKGRVSALLKFKKRINSPMAAKLVRGLIGIERGDDMRVYMNNELVHMKDYRMSQLRKKADKRPNELNLPNIALIASLVIMAMTAIIIQTIQSIGVYNGL